MREASYEGQQLIEEASGQSPRYQVSMLVSMCYVLVGGAESFGWDVFGRSSSHQVANSPSCQTVYKIHVCCLCVLVIWRVSECVGHLRKHPLELQKHSRSSSRYSYLAARVNSGVVSIVICIDILLRWNFRSSELIGGSFQPSLPNVGSGALVGSCGQLSASRRL